MQIKPQPWTGKFTGLNQIWSPYLTQVTTYVRTPKGFQHDQGDVHSNVSFFFPKEESLIAFEKINYYCYNKYFIKKKKTSQMKKDSYSKSNRMATINPTKLSSINNQYGYHPDISFCCNIWISISSGNNDKAVSFQSFGISQSYPEGPTCPHNLPHLIPQIPQWSLLWSP